ncbi:hypothetical protein FA10DRAFT_90333 [Acaromyces ingoldii]|uniref:Uncharacterized protein n=1 Tax=Acaromyces ingoldii TaxID=215250 RepID=A0A316YUH5_9BASI|nr:hypothetical protein FA10DRAFT_90333 [Acaromyces ingoldii]PWN92328.1 hypothetical protein FA10DRAFT_90333 [Acaromyces ingoldii]
MGRGNNRRLRSNWTLGHLRGCRALLLRVDPSTVRIGPTWLGLLCLRYSLLLVSLGLGAEGSPPFLILFPWTPILLARFYCIGWWVRFGFIFVRLWPSLARESHVIGPIHAQVEGRNVERKEREKRIVHIWCAVAISSRARGPWNR